MNTLQKLDAAIAETEAAKVRFDMNTSDLGEVRQYVTDWFKRAADAHKAELAKKRKERSE